MEIVVQGRNVEIPDHFRAHIFDKMSDIERDDRTAIRYEVVRITRETAACLKRANGSRSPAGRKEPESWSEPTAPTSTSRWIPHCTN